MKIVEQTPTTLKLRTTALEWAIWLTAIGIGLCVIGVIGAVQANWLGALVFWAIGGLLTIPSVWFVPYVTVFIFDRTVDRLLIQERYLVRSSETRYPLNTIQAVKTEWIEGSDNDRCLVISLVKPVGRPIYIQDIVQINTIQINNEAEYASIAELIRQFLDVGEQPAGT